MSDQNLFLPICGTFLFLLVLITAIFGMRARLKFAKRLLNVYNDKKTLDNWLKTHKTKHRLLLLISLSSSLGTLILGAFILSGALLMTKLSLTILVVLLLSGIISGTLMLIDYQRLAK
jgi:uncharacterized membrane protein YbaN (DUF454 family)